MENKKRLVFGKIKKRILNGESAPGFPINEEELARDLDVSKTPVREVLRQLEREGLVETIPGRGSTVSHITFQDIRDIFQIREILECGAAKRAALIHDETDFKMKRKELEKNSKQWAEDTEFSWGPVEDIHLFIITSIGNQKLVDTYGGLIDHIKRIRKHFNNRFSQKRFNELMEEHLEILDAIIEGKGRRAEMAVQNHLQIAQPGDIIVAATEGYDNAGYFGDLMATSAVARQVGGLAIDGCVRDSAVIMIVMSTVAAANWLIPRPMWVWDV